MTDTPLSITARCRGQDQACRYDGSNLFIDLSIFNMLDRPVALPLAYLQKTGPSVRLVDARTRTENYLKTNLASDDLRTQLTTIPPRGSVRLEWVITSFELEQYGKPVDVGAEFSLATTLQIGNEAVPFTGVARLRITDKR